MKVGSYGCYHRCPFRGGFAMTRYFFSLLLLVLPLLVLAKEKICLNMIVKNESPVIKRCLSSVKDVIDYWVIVDTGSTDGTQKIIQEFLKDITGELYERPWRNFGENRSEAYDLAKGKGDYILFMDADDTLEFEGEPQFPPLSSDLYMMWRGNKAFSYLKPQIAKADLNWKWVGVTHEYLGLDTPYTSEILDSVKYVTTDEGASARDPKKKFMRNVELLEEGLKKEPQNYRYAFYLAESYRDAGEPAKALEWYQKRVNMGGWDEEVFCALLQIGHLLQSMGFAMNLVTDSYLNAFHFRPHRVEPLYCLAEYYNRHGNHKMAYEYLKIREFIQKPDHKDSLFNMDWMEDYGMLFQLSIAAYYLGHYEEALKACDQLIAMEDIPDSWREQAKVNRAYPFAKLQEMKLKEEKETVIKAFPLGIRTSSTLLY